MRYARIVAAVAGVPWAIQPEKMRAVMSFLSFAAAGGKHTPREVEAIIGRPPMAYDDDETSDERRARLEAAERQATSDRGGIAVMALRGIVSPRLSDEMNVSGPGGTSAEGFAKRIRAAAADSNVAGIIVDVDSPGGNVYGVPEAFQAMLEVRDQKPIVAVVNPLTASAAFWIASAAGEIAITPSGEIGSVGVYMYHEDVSAALEAAGVKPTLIKAEQSPNKAETHPAFPLTEGTIAHQQEAVNRYASQFIADLARGRRVSTAHVVEKFGGGRMFGAEDAVAARLADRVSTLDAEIARMQDTIAKRHPNRRSGIESKRRRLAVA